MRTPKNLIYHALIGLVVEITNSSDRKSIGLKGKVIDETKNLIVIDLAGQSENKTKKIKIQKISSIFKFYLEGGQTKIIEGKEICFRPEERAKKLM